MSVNRERLAELGLEVEAAEKNYWDGFTNMRATGYLDPEVNDELHRRWDEAKRKRARALAGLPEEEPKPRQVPVAQPTSATPAAPIVEDDEEGQLRKWINERAVGGGRAAPGEERFPPGSLRTKATCANIVALIQRTDESDDEVEHVIERHNALHARVGELEKRFAEIEKSGVRYRGVWQKSDAYRRGDLATHEGSVWHANRETAERPGTGDCWSLAVKAGRDGKDSRP